MLELNRVGDVAEGPDALGGGPEMGIGNYVPLAVDLDATPLNFQQVTVGLAPGGHQQLVGYDDGTVGEFQVEGVVVDYLVDRDPKAEVHPIAVDAGQTLAYLLVDAP